MILPQFVELPDGERFFTLARTTERPVYSMQTQDRRLAISLGCEIKHASKLVYTTTFQKPAHDTFSKIVSVAIYAQGTIVHSGLRSFVHRINH